MKYLIAIVLTSIAFRVHAQSCHAPMADINLLMQEEQLARDVYQLANTKYQMHVFDCKIDAETNHWYMLRAFSTTPDAQMPEYGKITDSAFAKSFEDLKAMVQISSVEALKAGASIEETDIYVLEANRALAANDTERQVFDNLISASEQHLKSFMAELQAAGESYTPEMLTQERVDKLLGSAGCKPGGACAGKEHCAH